MNNEMIKSLSGLGSIYHNSKIRAKYGSWPFANLSQQTCILCGAKEDFTGFVKLIGTWNPQLETVEYICKNHREQKGNTIWDCFIGQDVELKTNRFFTLRYKLHRVWLFCFIILRFIYFFCLDWYSWKIYFPIAWWWKNAR